MAVSQLSAFILAAGASSRFGSQKMLHVMPSGKPLLLECIEIYQQAFENVDVVINVKNAELLTLVKRSGAKVIDSPRSEQGMSQSLIAGIRASSNANAWLIALGDMPYIQVETLSALERHASEGLIVMPEYQGKHGNPVIFGNHFKDDLLSLKGDVGAKKLTELHTTKLELLAVNDFGVVHDVDTPDSIRR